MDKYEVHHQNECYALGAFMKDGNYLDETQLQQKHFLNPFNRNLFRVMKGLRSEGKPTDFVSISQLGDNHLVTFGGIGTLSDLMEFGFEADRFTFFEQRMVEFIAVNEALEQMKTFEESVKYAHTTKELDSFISKINSIQVNTLKPQLTLQEKMQSLMEYHMNLPESGLSGVPTGFTSLDNVMDGWQKNDLIVVAARPSVGKTAFVLDVMRRGAKFQDFYGTFFSCEMGTDPVLNRLIAMEGNIPIMRMRNPNKFFSQEHWRRYQMACTNILDMSLDIREEKRLSDIRAAIRKKVQEYPDKKHFFAIDHLGHVKTNEHYQDKRTQYSAIVEELKDIQNEFKVPIVLIAQLNRSVTGKEDKRPSMNDIRESGTIEEIADMIIFPHRDSYFDKDKRASEKVQDMEIIIEKSRNGWVGTLDFKFNVEMNTFMEVQS